VYNENFLYEKRCVYKFVRGIYILFQENVTVFSMINRTRIVR